MKVALFTREYPPEVYGGAGVHVEYLARELRAFEDVTVHAWGVGDVPHTAWDALRATRPSCAALRSLSIDLTMAAGAQDAELVHTHTWYAQYRRPSGQARAGHPARRDRALAGAAAPVEGRAARAAATGCRRTPRRRRSRHADAVIAVSNGTEARHPARRTRRHRPGDGAA